MLFDEKLLDGTEEIITALSKLKSTVELKVAVHNEQFATDDTEQKIRDVFRKKRNHSDN